jgi:hypothetical protein
MAEVFPRLPDLTDQPISHTDIEYFIDGRDLFVMACTLPGMWW